MPSNKKKTQNPHLNQNRYEHQAEKYKHNGVNNETENSSDDIESDEFKASGWKQITKVKTRNQERKMFGFVSVHIKCMEM